MSEPNILVQIGTVIGSIFVGGGAAYKYLKPKKQDLESCPDSGCHEKVHQHGEDIREMKDSMNNDIFPKINKTAEDVAYIKGRIDEALKMRPA